MANTLAYGFVGLEHLFSERLEDVQVEEVDSAIQDSVEEHNRQVEAMAAEIWMPTTDYQVRFKQPGGGTLQPLDEWGNPRPVKEAGFYDVAFPWQGGGTAWGDNRISRALMTVEDVNRHVLESMRRDANWLRRHALAAMFDNATWSFDDPDHGALTIQPLANGDSVEYLKKSGTLATDDHFYAQANAIDDANNPFPTWHTELSEHPGNNGPYVAYIPTNIKSAVQGLTSYVDVGDPDVNEGADSATIVGRLTRGFGDEVLGKVDKVWVVEWSFLPDNYGIVVDRGSVEPPLKMRELPAESLQGFFRENHSPDGNLRENRFIRYAGFGAHNRVAALAYRIGNASYAIPAGYDAPLAV